MESQISEPLNDRPAHERQYVTKQLYALAAEGHLNSRSLEHGLRLVGHIPRQAAWRRFLDYLLLTLGALLLVCGIFFFFAYNWEALHRFVRFGLLEVAIVAAAGVAHYVGLRKLSGKVALLAAALLVGALLAVFGQEYQTGADSYGLFLTWMLLIAGWVFMGAFAPLWLLWLGLANLTLVLYLSQVWSGDFYWQLEALFLLNACALVLWEAARLRGIGWLQERWYARTIALVANGWATAVMLNFIFNWSASPVDSARTTLLAPVLYAIFCVATLYIYQYRIRDLFVLTGAALSLIAVTTSFVAQWTNLDDIMLFLVLGVLVILQAALAVTWLLRVQRLWGERSSVGAQNLVRDF